MLAINSSLPFVNISIPIPSAKLRDLQANDLLEVRLTFAGTPLLCLALAPQVAYIHIIISPVTTTQTTGPGTQLMLHMFITTMGKTPPSICIALDW